MPSIKASMELFDNFSKRLSTVNQGIEHTLQLMDRLHAAMQTNVKINVDTKGLEKINPAPTVDPALQQEKLNAAIMKTKLLEEQLRRSTENTEAARERARAAAQRTLVIEEKLRGAIEANRQKQEQFNQKIRQGNSDAGDMASTIKGMLATYLTIAGAQKFLQLGDEVIGANTRLGLVNDGLQTQLELQQKVLEVANDTRASYLATADLISKLGMFTEGVFDGNEDMLQFAERFNKLLVASGANAVSREIAILQMSQALGSGRLQGDELRSISEAAPLLLKTLADGMGVARGELKQLGSEGKLTADVIVKAFENQGQEIDELFAKMPMTFGAATTIMQNKVIEWIDILTGVEGPFRTVTELVQDLTAWMDSADGEKFFREMAKGITIFSDAVAATTRFVVDNMDVVQAVLIATGLVVTGLTIQWIAMWVAAAWPVLAVVGAIALVIYTLDQLGLMGDSVIGYLAGSFYYLFAFINNHVALVYNIFAALAEFMINGFIDPVYAVEKLFYDLAVSFWEYMYSMTKGAEEFAGSFMGVVLEAVNGIISGLNWLLEAISEIPGVEKINSLKLFDTDNVNAMSDGIKNMMDAIEAPTSDKNVLTIRRMEQMDLKNSFDKGYNAGNGLFDVSGLGALGLNGNIENIDRVGSVGSIDDTVDISSEDLKIMRDLAEMKAIQNFVTLTPTVQVTTGPISKDVDVDEVIRRIEDVMDEEIESSAQGVYNS